MNLAEAKATPVAWPGGYPIYSQMKDGGLLCHYCLVDKSNPIDETGEANGDDPSWIFLIASIYWEGETLECSHCGEMNIESAYGWVPDSKPKESGPASV